MAKELIDKLLRYEPEGIVRTLAMMTYNPSMGRALQQDGVGRFADMMVDSIPRLTKVVSREEFDTLHNSLCEQMIQSFRTAREETLSYGQAQKAINVFLKVHVDWAKQPAPDVAKRLIPFLHVPLDSRLMKFIKTSFPAEYRGLVTRIRDESNVGKFADMMFDSVPRLTKVVSREDFDTFHCSLCEQMIQSLTAREETLSYGQARRAINVFLKVHVDWARHPAPDVAGRLEPFVACSPVANEFSLKTVTKEIYIAWQILLRALHEERPILLDTIWVMERGNSQAADTDD